MCSADLIPVEALSNKTPGYKSSAGSASSWFQSDCISWFQETLCLRPCSCSNHVSAFVMQTPVNPGIVCSRLRLTPSSLCSYSGLLTTVRVFLGRYRPRYGVLHTAEPDWTCTRVLFPHPPPSKPYQSYIPSWFINPRRFCNSPGGLAVMCAFAPGREQVPACAWHQLENGWTGLGCRWQPHSAFRLYWRTGDPGAR